MEKLADRIMKVFAYALNLDQNYFSKYIDNPISALRALHYPSIKKNVFVWALSESPTPPCPNSGNLVLFF